jgi:hypothetical protein
MCFGRSDFRPIKGRNDRAALATSTKAPIVKMIETLSTAIPGGRLLPERRVIANMSSPYLQAVSCEFILFDGGE